MSPHNDPTERKDRQLAYAQRVQELTMRLVERTAARAEQALDNPAPDPEPDAPRARTPDHVLEFVRLTRALNQTMIIENRIANNDFDRQPRPYRTPSNTPSAPPDPRRKLIQDALYQATKSHPDRAQRRREIDHSIDQHLAADPAPTLRAADILEAVSKAIDLPLDPACLSDELLGIPIRPLSSPPERGSG